MGESSKFQKSWTFEIQILKLAVCPQSVNNFKFKWSFWKVSLKILNSGIILKTFTHEEKESIIRVRWDRKVCPSWSSFVSTRQASWCQNGDPLDNFFYPILTLTMYSYIPIQYCWNQLIVTLLSLLTDTYSKTCVKQPLSKIPKIGFQDQLSLNAGQSIAECSKGSILQYFRPSLSYHLSLRSLFYLFLSGRFTQVLLYIIATNKIKRSLSNCVKYLLQQNETKPCKVKG